MSILLILLSPGPGYHNSTCTCQSLIVCTNVKLNFQFVGRPIVNHYEGHNPVIRSPIEVHEHLMESLISFQIDWAPPQVAYGVGFGRTWYGWKDNFKMLPMAPVSGPNSSGVDTNRARNLTPSFGSGAATPSFSLWALYRVGAH
jgi:hypothetical protein